MHSWAWIVIGIYGVSMLFIFAYSLVQLNLLLKYLRARKEIVEIPAFPDKLPEVLIQLPVFNEYYVVERLIDAAVSLDYPKEKLVVQVLGR